MGEGIVAGVDGSRRGWIATVLRDGRLDRFEHITPVTTAFASLSDVDVIAINRHRHGRPTHQPRQQPPRQYT